MGTKLHELLAVNNQLEGQMNKVVTEQTETFLKKHHLYTEKVKTFQPLDENAPAVTEEQSKLNSEVSKELDWLRVHIAKAINSSHQINVANQTAIANLILDDDTTLAQSVPATTLLELEKTFAQIKILVAAIPTLDPAKGFTPDASRGRGIYKAREIVKPRTAKKKDKIVLFEPTATQPGQAQVYDADFVIGTIREQEWSAMLTPADKADMLERCEQIIRAAKRARSRANEVEVDLKNRIADDLVRYVFTVPENRD